MECGKSLEESDQRHGKSLGDRKTFPKVASTVCGISGTPKRPSNGFDELSESQPPRISKTRDALDEMSDIIRQLSDPLLLMHSSLEPPERSIGDLRRCVPVLIISPDRAIRKACMS